jgi:hypothetical protein
MLIDMVLYPNKFNGPSVIHTETCRMPAAHELTCRCLLTMFGFKDCVHIRKTQSNIGVENMG